MLFSKGVFRVSSVSPCGIFSYEKGLRVEPGPCVTQNLEPLTWVPIAISRCLKIKQETQILSPSLLSPCLKKPHYHFYQHPFHPRILRKTLKFKVRQ